MATGKNINDSALQKVTDFTNAVNRLYASATSSTKDGYIVLKELIDYILGETPANLWQITTNKLSNILQSIDYFSLFAKNVEVVRIGDGINPKVIVDPAQTFGITTGYWFGGGAGIYEGDANQVNHVVAGNQAFFMTTSSFNGAANSGAKLVNTGASATVPTIRPTRIDGNTGIGSAGAGQLSHIAGGVEQIRNTVTGTEIKVIKSGATQVAAGANSDEMWKTLGHATLPDNVIMHGVYLVLQNDVAGIAYVEQTDAYGLVFDGIVNKSLGTNTTSINIISSTNDLIGDRYQLQINAGERLVLRINGGDLFFTPLAYIINNTDYRIFVFRNETLNQYVTGAIGTFAVYIQGKANPITTTEYLVPNLAEMELVDVTGGTGTNPVTDNTYTTSLYQVLDLDAGDQISKINVNQNYITPYDFTQSTGTWSIISS